MFPSSPPLCPLEPWFGDREGVLSVGVGSQVESQTFTFAALELFHSHLLFVTSCIFFSSSSRCDRLSACACTSQIRQETPNWQEEELEILGVATVGKVHTFTDKLSRKMYPTACSGLKFARYSWEQSLLHPLILAQIFRRAQCTEMQYLWFHKRILWKPGMYSVAKMDSLGNLVLTIMKNSGKITSASFDTKCRFCRSCKLQCSSFTEACALQGDEKNSKYPFCCHPEM